MTADKLLDRTLPLLFATSSEKTELTNDFLQVLGIVMAECLDVENGLRRAKGSEQLTEPPEITTLSQDVAYDWRLLAVLPYGIAGVLAAEEDAANAAMYKNKYEAERAALVRCEFEDVVDSYAED